MARRETRSCSLPEESSWASSVIAGTWRRRRSPSKRRWSSVPADHGSCVVQPTALDLLDELPDLGGGGFGLLALNANERGLLLLIRESDLEQDVRQKNDRHDAKK